MREHVELYSTKFSVNKMFLSAASKLGLIKLIVLNADRIFSLKIEVF